MIETWKSRLRPLGTLACAAALLAGSSPLLIAGIRAPGPTGPEDDLGTLPATSSGEPPTINEDDLGTLPLSWEDPAGPHLTFTGPVSLVPGLLTGVTGPGQVGYRPGPEPGLVTAVLDGALGLALLHDDPRLAHVRVTLESGEAFTLAELHAGPRTTGVFGLAPDSRLAIPVRSFFERPQLAELKRLELDLLDPQGQAFRLSLRTHGGFLLLEQGAR